MPRNARRPASIFSPPPLNAGLRAHGGYAARWASFDLGRRAGLALSNFITKAALAVLALSVLGVCSCVANLTH